jgi:type I restriction enzyme M protein
MLDTATKKRIDDCRDILVGKLPDPKAQIEQITIGLIYKFMDDMDKEAVELGGKAKFFSDYTIPDLDNPKKKKIVPFAQYSWDNLFNAKVTATEMLALYQDAIAGMDKNPNIPQLFRDIFKNAYLPYRDPETLKMFLKTISEFEYTHSEKLGDAFEYLLSVMGSQGDAGQFRTPRHIIDFLVAIVNPSKNDTILDPACGTAGFLISAFKHIKEKNTKGLTPDERRKLIQNFVGYDISPDMVRLSLVNLYLHGFSDPHIYEYDTLSSEERWNEGYDVILANPPFMSPKGGIRPHKKFTISSNRSEVLFVDYIAEHLNPKGRAGIIVPEGVIFQSGTAYKDLRKMLVDNYLYAVVSLPAGVFNPYSGVKTSVLLMDAAFAKKSNEILFVKIDNDGYGLGSQRNAVKGGQLEEAVELLQQFKDGNFFGSEIAHVVSKKEIAKNGDYNLSGERYKINESNYGSVYELIELGKIFKLSSGRALTQKNLIPGSYDVFGGNGINGKHNEYFLEAPTLIIGRVGEYCGTVHITTPKSWVTDNGLYVTKYEKEANQKYLLTVLNYINLNQYSKVGGQPSISQSTIYEIKIPFPPLSIQEEIVAEIEGYQKIIDGSKAVVENYKPKIDIDPEWEMVELGEVAKPEYGFTEKAKGKGNARFIRITDIGADGKLIATEPKYIDITKEAKKSILKKNDILLARTGATYGKTMIFEDDYPAVFASFLMRLNFDLAKIFPKYYWVFAQSENYISQAASLMTGGGQPQFNGNAIIKIKLPIPPIKIQHQIIAQIENELTLVNANKQLIEIFEQKIKDRIAKVWGADKKDGVVYEENDLVTMAAEEKIK